MKMVGEYFPGVPILPAIGNNDCEYHDSAPTSDEADLYYQQMWDVFFEEVSSNSELTNNSDIK